MQKTDGDGIAFCVFPETRSGYVYYESKLFNMLILVADLSYHKISKKEKKRNKSIAFRSLYHLYSLKPLSYVELCDNKRMRGYFMNASLGPKTK